jgi:hypothetical protein
MLPQVITPSIGTIELSGTAAGDQHGNGAFATPSRDAVTS